MPTSILEEVDDLLEVAEAQGDDRLPEHGLRFPRPVDAPLPAAAGDDGAAPQCPPCGSSPAARMPGDHGGISFFCTACGHSWS